MKFLLTSAGITNDSIRRALINLLGGSISNFEAVFVPTAIYAQSGGGGYAWQELNELGKEGWHKFGVLELTALTSIPDEYWLPMVEEADVFIVGGGNTGYLSYWLQKSGLAEKLPEFLQDKVYLGISAGGMMVTHSLNVNSEKLEKTGIYYDDEYDEAAPLDAGSNKTLKLVDFVIRPHLNADYFPGATLENMEKWAAKVDVPLYAFDDQTAIQVIDGKVQIISEGEWKLFENL